jgi:D-hydroxyproline dehydrogenase subunit gamma
MPSVVALKVNGVCVEVAAGTTVAVATMQAGQPCRFSVSGTPRGPLCGMGICFECRMTINGILHCRTCQILCESGMDVATGVTSND